MTVAVRVITLNRPSRRNSLDLEIRPHLAEALEAADADPIVRAVVLTGAGGAFCAGGDVKIMERMPSESARPRLIAAQRIVRAIGYSGTPVVAAVEGPAYAAGLGLALACDRVVAARGARFSATFTRVGFACDLGLTWSLPRRVGSARAQHLMMFGGEIDSTEALRIGMVDEQVAEGGALDSALADAHRIAAGPRRALGLLKSAFVEPAQTLDAALESEIDIQAELFDTDDFAEGIAAFAERRPPVFPGT